MSLPRVYTISQFTRFKDGKPHSRGGAEKHFHMLAEACGKAGYACEQLQIDDPRLPAILEDPEAVFLVDSWMGSLVKRSQRVISSCISVWAETNLVAYGNPPDDMAMRQLEYWGRPATRAIAQCVLSKIHMEKWARHFNFPVTPLLKVVPLGVDTEEYHPSDRDRPYELKDALIIHAAPPGNRKKRPDVFEKMQGRYRVECLDADIGEEPEKYRRGDIFVHVPYSEDNCYSVIEAMATGMVCVFSDCVNPDKDQSVKIESGIGYLRGIPFAAYVKSDATQDEIEGAIALAWDNRTYLMPRVLAVKYYNLAQWEQGWLDSIRESLQDAAPSSALAAPALAAPATGSLGASISALASRATSPSQDLSAISARLAALASRPSESVRSAAPESMGTAMRLAASSGAVAAVAKAPAGTCLLLCGRMGVSPPIAAFRAELENHAWALAAPAPGESLSGSRFDLVLIEEQAGWNLQDIRSLKEGGALIAGNFPAVGTADWVMLLDVVLCATPQQSQALRGAGKAAYCLPPGNAGAAKLREILARHQFYRRNPYPPVDWTRISYGHTEISRGEVSAEMTSSWQNEDIPGRQRALVQTELKEMYLGRIPKPYQTLADALSPYAAGGLRLLEVGCASGYYYEILEYLLDRPIEYTGADYSGNLIAMARRLYPGVPFQVADGAAMPFADGEFPIVVSSCVLLHCPNYPEHIRETVRVAGKVVIASRTPICRRRPTQFQKKFAYGVETVELNFNETEFVAAFTAHGLKLVKSIVLDSNDALDNHCITYVFEKDAVTASKPSERGTLAVAWRNRADMVAAKGGDGIVIEETIRGLQGLGHRADLRLEPLPDLRAYDVVHLNNISRSQDTLEHLRHAKAAGKPTVLTSLYEDMDRYLKPAMKTDLLFRYLATKQQNVPLEALSQLRASFELDADPLADPIARQLGIGDPVRQVEILREVDLILTSGKRESESIRAKFGATAPMTEMLYGFNRQFRGADGRLFSERHGLREFALCVGRLEPRKNQWQLMEIFRSLPQMKLVLVGVFSDPSMEPLMRAYAPPNVVFFPRLPLEELASAYAAARIHILPSWYELPGLVSLEAAAAGSRVATTDWGTARDYLGDFAWYLPPDDPVRMRGVILEAIDSAPKPGLQEHVIESFSWEKTARSAAEAYRRVLDGRRKS